MYFEADHEEYNIAIYCEHPEIEKTYRRRGPPIRDKVHSDKFKQKNPGFFEEDGYLWVKTIRDHDIFIDFLKNFITNTIPDNLKIVNLSNSKETVTRSGKRSIYVLVNMVLPFT